MSSKLDNDLSQSASRDQPAIFNTDRGSQFTSDALTGRLRRADIAISRDGRALDNIFIERHVLLRNAEKDARRTVKYEEVYLKSYQSVPEAMTRLKAYLHFYNEERLHQSLGYFTPAAVYATAR